MQHAKQSRILDFARVSLATLSIAVAAPHPIHALDTKITAGSSENQRHLGIYAETTFFMKKDGVRHYLVAANRNDLCQIACRPSDINTFQVVSDGNLKNPLKITFGDQVFSYTPFAGGSFVSLTN